MENIKNPSENFKCQKQTLREIIEDGIIDKSKKYIKKNSEKLKKAKLSNSVLDMLVQKHVLLYSIKGEANDSSVLDWINRSTERCKTNKSNYSSNRAIRHKVKESDKGNEYFANHIKNLDSILSELKYETKTSLVMHSPNTYNLWRDATSKIEEGLRLLIRVNKEFIPKESE